MCVYIYVCECMNANVHACMYVVDLYGLLMKQNFKTKFFFKCFDSFFYVCC